MDQVRIGLGEAIRALRQAKGLSQERLALAAGVHRSFIFRLEHGAVTVSVDTLSRITRPLDVSLSELFARAERTEGSA